jgi:hypothetical protein
MNVLTIHEKGTYMLNYHLSTYGHCWVMHPIAQSILLGVFIQGNVLIQKYCEGSHAM